jgi:O-antigen/teichoic acid export membrane protein
MIGYFKSPDEVGIYNAAMKTALLISTILLSFNTIFSPIISDLYNQDKMKKLGVLFKTVTKWRFSICFPLFLLIVLFSKEIMSIFGQEFIQGTSVLIILALGHLVTASVGPVGQVLSMSGRQNIMMVNNIVLSCLNIILNYMLIPAYGITGAAVASGISIAVFEIIMLLEVYIIMKMLPHSIKIIKPFVAGLASSVLILFLDNALISLHTNQKLIIYIPLFSSVFALVLYTLGIDDEDRFIIDHIKNKCLALFTTA